MDIEHDDTNSANDSGSTTNQNVAGFQSQPVNGDRHDNPKQEKDKSEVSGCNVGAGTSSVSCSKKREYPTTMEKSAAKVIKLTCDNNATDGEHERPAAEQSIEEKEPESSGELAEEATPSSSNLADTDARSSSRSPTGSILFSEVEENAQFSDVDNSPEESNSSESSSSSSSSSSNSSSSISSVSNFSSSSMDLPSVSSPLDDEDDDDLDLMFDFNEGSILSDDHHSDGNEEKLPSVLKKTLPTDKFFFPREIMNRQFNCGDSRRRSYSKFDMNVYASRRMTQRLELYKSLRKHNGCVNTLSFNQTGEILISASDDRHVCLWDWIRNKSFLYYDSGHIANVFQAKFLPSSGDTQLVTCGQDAQIRIGVLDSCGVKSNQLIVEHDKVVHKLAMQPQMPNSFLSAGEDGVVYSVDVRESNSNCHKLLKVVDPVTKRNTPVCLYSIHCNPMKNYEFIVCGNHEEIFFYDQRIISKKKQRPFKSFRVGGSFSNRTITSAVFNYNGTEVLGSYNDKDIFLFNTEETKKYVFHYDGHRNFATVKGVNFYGPRSEYIVSGSDCGHVYLWDKKSEAIVQWLKGDKNIVNCLEPHPLFPVLATSGLDSDIKIWMPTANNFDSVLDNKVFRRVVKKNFRYKGNTFSRDDLRVSLFYLMSTGRY